MYDPAAGDRVPLDGTILAECNTVNEYSDTEDYKPTTDPVKANVITSKVLSFDPLDDKHKFVVDIDLPAKLIASSTPGHYHLYIDKEMSWNEYFAVLEAMGNAGLVEQGYVSASKRRNFTALRLPWIKKP